MFRLRDSIERWLIWLELDRRPRPLGNGDRASALDRMFPPGRLPRLFVSLHELDDRLADEAPTARHAPSPELRRRSLEAIRQCVVAGHDPTPRRWSPALATFALCSLILLVTFTAPSLTRQNDRTRSRPIASLIPTMSRSIDPKLDFIVNPLITEAKGIADDLSTSARRFRSLVLSESDQTENEDSAVSDEPVADPNTHS